MPDSRLAPLRELFYTLIPYTEHIYLGTILIFTVILFLSFIMKRTVDKYWGLMCCSALWGIFLFTTWYSSHIRPILVSRYLIMPLCLSIIGISTVARSLPKYITAVICLFCIAIGLMRYSSAIQVQANHNTTRTIAFAREHFTEHDTLLYTDTNTDNGYFTLCLDYYFPHITCIPLENASYTALEEYLSTGSNTANPQQNVWLIDTSCSVTKENPSGTNFTIEYCGSYGFSAITFDIYRITNQPAD